MSSIAVCMIVKNEEEVLPRCLDAIKGLWDELIIVDTGSTDRTVEIAQSYGAKVLHHEWIAPGNKGEARNFGIAAAVSQWIAVLDADEVLHDAAGVRRAILGLGNDIDAIQVQFLNYDNGNEQSLVWYQIRVFRRGRLAYRYREHEIPVGENIGLAQSGIVIEHRVPEGRQQTKSAAMMARLTLDVQENPNDPHPLYFLHRECVNQGDYAQGIDLGLQYLTIAQPLGLIVGDSYANLAIAYQRLGNILEARKALHLAIGEEPRRREWWYRLGLLHYDCQEWNLAFAALRAAAEIAPNDVRQWEPTTLARIYDLMGLVQHEIAHALAHSHEHAHSH